MKETAYSVYDYGEIIDRYLAATSPIEGPSCFPVEIRYSANNMTDPPDITCEVFDLRDGGHVSIFSDGVDQNTPLAAFHASLRRLREVVGFCLEACDKRMPYKDVMEAYLGRKDDEKDDLPF